jgi:hypothetical protein
MLKEKLKIIKKSYTYVSSYGTPIEKMLIKKGLVTK